MLEVAIVSTKCALRDEFPEFMEFWNEKSWEAKPEEAVEEVKEENESGNTDTAEPETSDVDNEQ